MQIAVSGMRPDADTPSLRKLDGFAHDVGITGMEAAGDIDRRRKLDHGGVVAHLPSAESFTQIAIEIDGCHVGLPLREPIRD